MIINGDEIVFHNQDFNFLRKFGLEKAADMVLDYCQRNDTPFIYDTYQFSDYFGIARKELFKIVKNVDSYYRRVTIPKKNGDHRVLNVPCDELKIFQKMILKNILYKLPVSKYATAYRKGGTLVDNASPHIDKKYILKMDVTDFFCSITFSKIYNSVFNTKYYPKQIGYILTVLCCYKDVLPQGAPTSPAISNLVMKHFDDTIGEWCKKRDISYTRYCDDLTFSSDKPLYMVYEKVKSMLENMGMELNERKTHFITDASRQTVTGLVVNDKVSVPREYKRKLRQEIYYLYKYGPESAVRRIPKNEYKIFWGFNDILCYLLSLYGRINYVLSVEKNNKFFIEASERVWKISEEF